MNKLIKCKKTNFKRSYAFMLTIIFQELWRDHPSMNQV